MSTAESGCGELGMVPSGVENVGGEPPVPPTEPVTSPFVLVSPELVLVLLELVLPPTDALSVELPSVVTALLPPEPVVVPALVELVEVTDTMPTVIVAAPVAAGPLVDGLVVVSPELVFAASPSLLAGVVPESPLQPASPSTSSE